jgi:hypothetical protein
LKKNVLIFDPKVLKEMFEEADFRAEGSLDPSELAATIGGAREICRQTGIAAEMHAYEMLIEWKHKALKRLRTGGEARPLTFHAPHTKKMGARRPLPQAQAHPGVEAAGHAAAGHPTASAHAGHRRPKGREERESPASSYALPSTHVQSSFEAPVQALLTCTHSPCFRMPISLSAGCVWVRVCLG